MLHDNIAVSGPLESMFPFALLSYACEVVLELIIAHLIRIFRPIMYMYSAWPIRRTSSVKISPREFYFLPLFST